MGTRWEYEVVEEPNAVALQERLTRVGRDGWEATSLACAGEGRLLALVRRPMTEADGGEVTPDQSRPQNGTRLGSNGLDVSRR